MDKINFQPSGGGNPKTFREMLPYLTVKNGLLQHADRSFALGMELYSCSDESATDEMLKERSDLFRRLLLNLNPEITMAIHLTIDPGVPEILKYHEGRKSQNEIFNKIHDGRIKASGISSDGLSEDKDQDAKHVYAFGPTGSGKSVTILYILANYMVFNPVIRIIDAAKIGGSRKGIPIKFYLK